MWGSRTSSIQLRKSINRLKNLGTVPGPPKENDVNLTTDPSRSLSASREKEIVSNLAFVSSTSDNSLKVMAVCLEEHPAKEAVTIRISSNTGDLSAVTHGFRNLARTLEDAARRVNSRADNIEKLLRQVVSLDRLRILSRLRSRHAKRTQKTIGKPALIYQLNQALDSIKIQKLQSKKIELRSAKTMAGYLQALFARLECIADPVAEAQGLEDLLRQIVKQAHDMTLSINISTLLQDLLPNSELITHLSEGIGKLGRYYSVCPELIGAVRNTQSPIFRNIFVEPFRIQIPTSVPGNTMKVHAEIQLLFFYEMNPRLLRPRYICSSKSACYLCNLFFQLHGGSHVPRTHGRIYDQWILPDWLDLPDNNKKALRGVITKFESTLRKHAEGLAKSNKVKYPFPNESVLLPHNSYPSSSVLYEHCNSSSASISTVRPQSHLQSNFRSEAASLQEELPLTPPITPPGLPYLHKSTNDREGSLSSGRTIRPAEHVEGKIVQNVNALPIVIIGHNELPYSQLINLTTPSLCLHLDELHLTLDFERVASGRLSIMNSTNGVSNIGDCHIFGIENIPIHTDMRIDCSQASNMLTCGLQSASRGLIYITFFWDNN